MERQAVLLEMTVNAFVALGPESGLLPDEREILAQLRFDDAQVGLSNACPTGSSEAIGPTPIEDL